MLCAAAQKDAVGAAINGLLAADKANALGVEGFGALDIVDKQTDRSDLGDLEWARQHHTPDIIIRR